MIYRKTALADLDAVLAVYRRAKAFMDQTGNPDQWEEGYPSGTMVEEDVRSGIGRVLADEDGKILAVLAFFTEEDPAYREIRDGAWPSDAPYAVVHRIATGEPGRGLAAIALGEAVKEAVSLGFTELRMDTYKDNLPMQRFLAREGFIRCGTVSLNGDFTDEKRLRLAYAKDLTKA